MSDVSGLYKYAPQSIDAIGREVSGRDGRSLVPATLLVLLVATLLVLLVTTLLLDTLVRTAVNGDGGNGCGGSRSRGGDSGSGRCGGGGSSTSAASSAIVRNGELQKR